MESKMKPASMFLCNQSLACLQHYSNPPLEMWGVRTFADQYLDNQLQLSKMASMDIQEKTGYKWIEQSMADCQKDYLPPDTLHRVVLFSPSVCRTMELMKTIQQTYPITGTFCSVLFSKCSIVKSYCPYLLICIYSSKINLN